MNQKSNFLLIVMLFCLGKMVIGQSNAKPYLFEATLDGKAIEMGSSQRITGQSVIIVRLSNVGGPDYAVSAKTVDLEIATELGGSKKIASFKPVRQDDGSYLATITTGSSQGTKMTYTFNGVQIRKNGVVQKINIPARARMLLVEFY